MTTQWIQIYSTYGYSEVTVRDILLAVFHILNFNDTNINSDLSYPECEWQNI